MRDLKITAPTPAGRAGPPFPWLPRPRLPTRGAIVVTAFLAVLFEATYLAAIYVRGEFLFRAADASLIVGTTWLVVGVKLAVFYLAGICHRPWRSARFGDLSRLLAAATVGVALLAGLNLLGLTRGRPGWPLIPRSVMLIDWAFTLLAVGGMQAAVRSLYEQIMPATGVGSRRVVLVVDASPAGVALAESLGRMHPPEGRGLYLVAGFLDDDPGRQGLAVGRSRVLGPVDAAVACAERLRVAEVIVLEGSIFGPRLQTLCDACAAVDVLVRIAEPALPGSLPLVRDLDLHDLLSRPQARLSSHDAHVRPFLAGRTVLVTGAGGSIGGAICRELVRFGPERLLLVERSECGLFAIHRELEATAPGICLEPILVDVGDAERLDGLLAEHKPQVIVHAAAFKHVPLLEAHPVEAVANNVLATAALAELADAHGVEVVVALSTDKAVHPASVMGGTKLVAERFLQSFACHSSTRFVAVRFGNVIGSSGSAVPIFRDQLLRGLPCTITHPEATRYFMTLGEAAQLVLLAGSLPEGGTYVLEMGSPIRIVDLVGRLAYVMRIPAEEVKVEFCGLRPGEKLEEELFFEDERREPTINPLVTRVSRPARSLREVRVWLEELQAAATDGPAAAARTLARIVAADAGRSVTPGGRPGVDRLAEQRA